MSEWTYLPALPPSGVRIEMASDIRTGKALQRLPTPGDVVTRTAVWRGDTPRFFAWRLAEEPPIAPHPFVLGARLECWRRGCEFPPDHPIHAPTKGAWTATLLGTEEG